MNTTIAILLAVGFIFAIGLVGVAVSAPSVAADPILCEEDPTHEWCIEYCGGHGQPPCPPD